MKVIAALLLALLLALHAAPAAAAAEDCPPDQWRAYEGDFTSDRGCIPQTKCVRFLQFEAVSPTATSDRVCQGHLWWRGILFCLLFLIGLKCRNVWPKMQQAEEDTVASWDKLDEKSCEIWQFAHVHFTVPGQSKQKRLTEAEEDKKNKVHGEIDTLTTAHKDTCKKCRRARTCFYLWCGALVLVDSAIVML
jgi:hypothetical protein